MFWSILLSYTSFTCTLCEFHPLRFLVCSAHLIFVVSTIIFHNIRLYMMIPYTIIDIILHTPIYRQPVLNMVLSPTKDHLYVIWLNINVKWWYDMTNQMYIIPTTTSIPLSRRVVACHRNNACQDECDWSYNRCNHCIHINYWWYTQVIWTMLPFILGRSPSPYLSCKVLIGAS